MTDPFAAAKQNIDPFAAAKAEVQREPDPFAAAKASIGSDTSADDSYSKLRKEMDRGLGEEFSESNWLVTEFIKPNEIDTIAQKHNVSAETLRKWLPFLGGNIPVEKASSGDWAKAVAGMAGSVLMGVPQKIAKQTQSPEMQRALDDLQELARARKSLFTASVENVALPALTIGQSTGAQALAGAATGAAAGYGSSRQGEEFSGTITGAAIGGAIGGTVGKLVSKRPIDTAKLAEKQTERAEKLVQSNRNIAIELDHRMSETTQADGIISDVIFGNKALSIDDAKDIVYSYFPNRLARLMDATTEEGRIFRKELGKGAKESVETEAVIKLANEKIGNTEKQLANELGQHGEGTANERIRKWAGLSEVSGQGEAYSRKRLDEMFRKNHVLDILSDRGIQGEGSTAVSHVMDLFSDAQYVLRHYDEQLPGLGIENAHKKLVKGYNRMSFPREEMRDWINSIFKRNKAAGVDKIAVNGADIIRAVESGQQLTPKQELAFRGFREFWDRSLNKLDDLANEYGIDPLAIKERANYIPVQLADAHKLEIETEKRLRNMVRDARSLAPDIQINTLNDIPDNVYNTLLSNPNHSETIKFIGMLGDNSVNDVAGLSKAYTKAFSPASNAMKLETIAKAALERKDIVPMWARETDLYKLADKWTNNTLRHMFMREGIDQLRSRMSTLKEIGATQQAEYINKLLQDVTGIRKGTAAEVFSDLQKKFLIKLDKAEASAPEGSAKRATITAIRMIPTLLQDLSRQVYPNLLGAANPRTLTMNLTQTFTKTLPEFGSAYGSSLFLRGAMSLGGLKNIPKHLKELEAAGLSPRKYVGAGRAYLAEELARGNITQLTASALRTIADIGMKPYEIAEGVNRSIAWGASKMMAKDLSSGSKLARKSLSNFPTSVKQAVAKAEKAGDWQEVQHIIGEHIINNTQYQYNRASMSQYGRTMGPLFSTFSKWPTATLGQALESYRSHGFIKGSTEVANQLVLPFVLLEIADDIMDMPTTVSEGEKSDRMAKIFSSQGLSQAAPIGNIGGIMSGDFFTPPFVDTSLKIFSSLKQSEFEDKMEALKKAATNGLYMFAPGGLGGWVRFVTDDISTLYTGHRPQGSNFIERSEEGWSRLNQ